MSSSEFLSVSIPDLTVTEVDDELTPLLQDFEKLAITSNDTYDKPLLAPPPEKKLTVTESMVVHKAEFKPHSGVPEVVQKIIVAEHERKKQIIDMWKNEGQTTYLVPGSPQMREAKMKAKLIAKQMARDELRIKEMESQASPSDAFTAPPILPVEPESALVIRPEEEALAEKAGRPIKKHKKKGKKKK